MKSAVLPVKVLPSAHRELPNLVGCGVDRAQGIEGELVAREFVERGADEGESVATALRTTVLVSWILDL